MGVNGVMQMLGSSRQQGASGNGASALAQGGPVDIRRRRPDRLVVPPGRRQRVMVLHQWTLTMISPFMGLGYGMERRIIHAM